MRALVPRRTADTWNAIALQQLATLAAEQHAEIESLRLMLAWADDTAAFWREQAMRLGDKIEATVRSVAA